MKANGIRSEDISVVIQGAADVENTPILIKSIRKYLPQSEIILSTWESANVSQCFGVDILVINKDPGAVPMDVDGNAPYNINRMLVSTKNGIAKATKTYILKCRSDVVLLGTNFLYFFNQFKKRDSAYILAKHKILLNSLYCMKCEAEGNLVHPTPYHISDWYCFGLREDILQLFSLPLIEENEFSRYFAYHPKPREYEIPWLNSRLWRFPPEQYLGVMYAKLKFPDLDFENCLEYEQIDFAESEKFIVNNFIILDPATFQIISNKPYYHTISKRLYLAPAHVWNGLYYEHIYMKDYKKYCDPLFTLPCDTLKMKRLFYEQYLKIRRHLGQPHDLKATIYIRG